MKKTRSVRSRSIGCAAAGVMLSVCLTVSAAPAFADPVDPVNDWGMYDALLEQIRSETVPEQRSALMHQAEDMLMATHCIIPLYDYNDGFLAKDYVSGVYSDAHNRKYFMYSDLANGSDTLKACVGMDVFTADPAYAISPEDFTVIGQLFSGLYTYNAAGEIVPACAEGYTLSEDGRTCTVTLKEGLKWSDGTDLTAGDFVYAWQRAVNNYADYSYLFQSLNGDPYGELTDLQVTAVDDRTLQFATAAPCAYMTDLLTYPVFYPVPSAFLSVNDTPDNPGAWSMNAGFPSNGAYTLTEWDPEGRITLEKNPYWYDADQVKTEKLELYYGIYDEAVAYLAYGEGELDFTDLFPDNLLPSMIEEQSPELSLQTSLGLTYLGFQAGSPLFEGKTPEQAAAMREAISLLIDRERYCYEALHCTGTPAYSFIPAGMSDGNGGIFGDPNASDTAAAPEDRDAAVQQARTLLESAGYQFDASGMLSADTPLSFTFTVNDSPALSELAEYIRSDLAQIGIDMKVVSTDWETMRALQAGGDYDLIRSGWICDANDPSELLELMASDSPQNICRLGSGN